MKEFLNFINGEYVRNASGKTFQDINPVNGSVIGSIYEAGQAEVDAFDVVGEVRDLVLAKRQRKIFGQRGHQRDDQRRR